jgi:importin subunit alpha-1
VKLGFVPILVSLLKRADNHTLQLEAAWALTNIASGSSNHTEELIKNAAVSELVHWITHPDDKVKEQCIWAIGNIAADSAKHREYVLALGAMTQILKALSETKQLSMIKLGAWAISCLCYGDQENNYKFTSVDYDDAEVLSNVCFSFTYLCYNAKKGKSKTFLKRIDNCVSTGCVPKLVKLIL